MKTKHIGDSIGTKFFLLGVLLLCCLLSRDSFGQVDQGAVTGVVRDSTGAIIQDAQVTLTNTSTAFALSTQTDSSGTYIFSPVKIGNYSVSATKQGFSTTTQENIEVHVQGRAVANIALKAGEVSTNVTVDSAPPVLQTEDGSTGQVVDSKSINDTPLNGRNWVFITQLTAGVTPSNGSRGQGTGDFNANGQRAEQNNFIMDGVDNNVNVVDFYNGASYVVRPPPDALAEFKVQTGAYSAEFGHSAGATVNASIKSGSNQIHGNLWEYVRNDAFDVREFFQGSSPIAKYRQNQFGATLGFPLVKNKLFFFGDAEANRIVFGETHSGYTVPTARMRTGDFSELLNPALVNGNTSQLYLPNSAANGTTPVAGNRLDLSGIALNPVALKLLSLYPNPNVGVPGQTYNNYTVQTNTTDNTFQWDVRTDWNISSKDQAFGRYSYSLEPTKYPPPLGPILDGGNFGDTGANSSLGENFAGSETHAFTESLTNEFRFGYNYGHFSGLQVNGNTDIAPTYGLGGIPFGPDNGGLPMINVGGISRIGPPCCLVTDERENVYQILDNVTKIWGNHTIKGGVNFQRIRVSTLQPGLGRGEYDYSGLYTSQAGTPNTGYGVADFLTNNMNSSAVTQIATIDDVRWNRSVYFQDDWKASQKLTLNIGIRYDNTTPYLERHDNQAAFITTGPLVASKGTGTFLLPKSKRGVALPASVTRLFALDNITVKYSDNRRLVDGQNLNFAPRLGFAYMLTSRAVVRGGFGIFFGGLESVGGSPNFGKNVPFTFDSSFNATSCVAGGSCPTNGFTLETGFSNALAVGLLNAANQPTLIGSESKVRTPYSEQFNLSTEYGITNNLVATLSYVGSLGRHLATNPNINSQTALTPSDFGGYVSPAGDNVYPFNPFPHFGYVAYSAYDAVSSYNSLQAKLQQHLSHGVSYLASYTWAHSLDNAPAPLNEGNNAYRNPNIVPISQDYSNSGFDVRQRFTLNGNVELPFGKNRRFLNSSGPLDYLVGGWSSSLVFRAQTGTPISIGTNSLISPSGANVLAVRIGDPYKAGGAPNASNPGISCPTAVRTVTHWFNPCAFANPKPDNIGYTNQLYPDGKTHVPNTVSGSAALPYLGSPSNQIYGPGYERIDSSIFKSFPTFREQSIQFRADIFNVLNTPGYGDPSNTGISSAGGLITGARSFQKNTPDSRFFQFALKYSF